MSNKLEKFVTPHDELMALAGKWAEPTPQDDCTLYTMGQRTARNQCAAELRALANEGKTDRQANSSGANRGDGASGPRVRGRDMTNAAPHDELVALAVDLEASAEYAGYMQETREAYAEAAQKLRALLDSDAFRAMARNDARYRWLRDQNAITENPAAWTITRCDFTDEDGPARYWVGTDLDAAIDAAASGAGEG